MPNLSTTRLRASHVARANSARAAMNVRARRASTKLRHEPNIASGALKHDFDAAAAPFHNCAIKGPITSDRRAGITGADARIKIDRAFWIGDAGRGRPDALAVRSRTKAGATLVTSWATAPQHHWPPGPPSRIARLQPSAHRSLVVARACHRIASGADVHLL